MVVVAIIGIMTAAVMPSMTEMVASNRQHGAAVDLMLLARRARTEALFGGYATEVVYDQVDGDEDDGVAVLLSGFTSSCSHATTLELTLPLVGWKVRGWQPLFPPPQGYVFLRSAALGSHRVFGVMELPDGTVQNLARICYEPNGKTWTSLTRAGGPIAQQTTSAVLRVRRSVGGVLRGVERQVVFPPGGTARLR